MKNLVKIVMPVAAFILASAGAISSNSGSAKSAVADTPGYNRISPNAPCNEVRLCNNQGDQICTLSGDQVFEKVGANCAKELYHRN